MINIEGRKESGFSGRCHKGSLGVCEFRDSILHFVEQMILRRQQNARVMTNMLVGDHGRRYYLTPGVSAMRAFLLLLPFS